MSPTIPYEVSDRIVGLMDDDDRANTHIHAIIHTGDDDGVDYYIAIMERQYDGDRYLNERYVALAKPDNDDFEDTFMQNGINRQFPDGMLEAVVDSYKAAQSRREWFASDERDPQDTEPFYTSIQ